MAKKRKDGRYAKQIVTGYKDGRPVRKTVYGKTLKELDKNYRECRDKIESGCLLENQNMKFAELAELWLVNTKKGELKPQSYNNISSQIKGLNSHIGEMLVKDIKRGHIEQIRAYVVDEGKPAKYNKMLEHARAIFGYAIESNIIAKNPTLGMKRIKYSAQKRALTDDERLLIDKAELDQMERCFVALLLYTGMRRSEALALNVSDIDFDKMCINVSKTLVQFKSVKAQEAIQGFTKTDAGKRLIPISMPLLPVLKKYCKGRVGVMFLTSYRNYMGSGTFDRFWDGVLAKLKVANGGDIANDITPHIFRHTYASDLYKSGTDIKAAQYLLGHKDIKTTLDTYTHFGYDDVKIDGLEEYYKRHAVKIQSEEKVIPLKALN